MSLVYASFATALFARIAVITGISLWPTTITRFYKHFVLLCFRRFQTIRASFCMSYLKCVFVYFRCPCTRFPSSNHVTSLDAYVGCVFLQPAALRAYKWQAVKSNTKSPEFLRTFAKRSVVEFNEVMPSSSSACWQTKPDDQTAFIVMVRTRVDMWTNGWNGFMLSTFLYNYVYNYVMYHMYMYCARTSMREI